VFQYSAIVRDRARGLCLRLDKLPVAAEVQDFGILRSALSLNDDGAIGMQIDADARRGLRIPVAGAFVE
ncbi:hypothetical protein COLO4_02313, partial [Corchorus olitorius]